MITKFAFLHTSHVLIPLFSKLAKEFLPELETFHISDESLIRNTISAGRLKKETIRRLVTLIGSAHDGGADAVMVTCSSMGEGVKLAREMFDFPVLRVDEAMAEAAVRMGRTIGVVATLQTTLGPTIKLIEEAAAAAGRKVEVVPSLCEGAFQAVLAGKGEQHDALLSRSLVSVREAVDVVVLAQASMARVAEHLPVNGGAPILSSPELGVRQARMKLIETPSAAA